MTETLIGTFSDYAGPRRQWFDVAGTCTDCDHAVCFDCLGSGAHHCACTYDKDGRRLT